jgi:hypothetical protein
MLPIPTVSIGICQITTSNTLTTNHLFPPADLSDKEFRTFLGLRLRISNLYQPNWCPYWRRLYIAYYICNHTNFLWALYSHKVQPMQDTAAPVIQAATVATAIQGAIAATAPVI